MVTMMAWIRSVDDASVARLTMDGEYWSPDAVKRGGQVLEDVTLLVCWLLIHPLATTLRRCRALPSVRPLLCVHPCRALPSCLSLCIARDCRALPSLQDLLCLRPCRALPFLQDLLLVRPCRDLPFLQDLLLARP